MNFFLLVLLSLLLFTSAASGSPVAHDNDDDEETRRPTDRDDDGDVSSTLPTFTVQRLDAPIERIEIRLIDDNTTHSVPEVTERPMHSERTETDGSMSTDEPENIHHTHQDPSPPPTESVQSEDEMYKKVEYVVQPTVPEPTEPVEEVSTSPVEPIVIGEDPSYFSTMPSEKHANAEAKAWISVSLSPSIPKFDGDIDEDDLPPPPPIGDEDGDEVEEECLANKEKLTDEVIERLRGETSTYYRLVKQRNDQQKEHCTAEVLADNTTEMYRRCANWRAEKLVYYYKLMRKTYCQVDNWPNSKKIKTTYGEYLTLFGTFYAFQK